MVTVAVLLLVPLGAGCGGPTRAAGSGPSFYDQSALEPWQGELQQLFDDSIHPAAVGMSLEGERPEDDLQLVNRAAFSALVSRMRVSTVTRDAVGAKVSYHLTLELVDAPLVPPRAEAKKVELTIRRGAPSFGIVSALEGTLRGRTFIGLLRWFAGPRGPELHWHLTADTPEVAGAVSAAGALEEAAQQ